MEETQAPDAPEAPPRGAAVLTMARALRQAADPSALDISTLDGRSLSRVRSAVLRLSREGWDAGRIARKLRLGSSDVALILKSSSAAHGGAPDRSGRLTGPVSTSRG